jgi:uncharacterized protein YkwD
MWRVLLVIGVFACTLAAPSAAAVRDPLDTDAPRSATEAPPAVIDARVVQREPWPPEGSGSSLFLVDLDEILNGWVPASSIVVRIEDTARISSLFRRGHELRLVVTEQPDGTYRVLSARPANRDTAMDHDPLPPPLAITPFEAPEDRVPARAKNGSATYEEQVVELVNQERWTNGELPPLKKVDELDASSEEHSENMAIRDFFAHCDLDTGDSFGDRIWAHGYFYSSASENIAAGASSPSSVMSAWMASSGHRANILSTSYREIGVGYVYQSGDLGNVRRDLDYNCVADSFNHGPWGNYWTQNFGSRGGVYPVVIDREAYEATTTAVDLYVYGVGWADDMRFSNDGVSWTDWESYNPNESWTLSSGNGVKTVYAEIRSGSTVKAASDTIVLNATCPHPDTIDLSGETVTTTQVHEACTQINAGPAYAVMSPGDVTLDAPTVVLKNGFSVGSGGQLVAGS